MSHEITLAKAVEKAEQAEVVSRLLESYPHRLEDSEVTAIASLLARLTGEVATWLIEEQAQSRDAKAPRGGKHA
jgi:hypothetical protein